MKKRESLLTIGLVGPFGSGKSTLTKIIEEQGFSSVRLSQFIEEEIKKKNIQGDNKRKILQDVGNSLRKQYGADILTKKALELAVRNHASLLVIDGIRNVGEIEYLKKNSTCFIVGITSDVKARYKRLQNVQGRQSTSFVEFVRFESRERGKGQRQNGQQAAKCWEMRDFEIINDTSVAALGEKTVSLVALLKKNQMRVILLGPPGAGKSTQGKLLSQQFNLPWISVGELLREAYKHGLPAGVEWWERYGSKGVNAPISLKFGLLEKKMNESKKGYVLDDFPRTREDLEALKEHILRTRSSIDRVILIDVTEKISIRRILKRWTTNSKRGAARYDDSPYILKIRIREGYKRELPLVKEYFRKDNLLVEIDGNGRKTIHDVNREIIQAIIRGKT